ncbi:hypothetical protein, partial [Rhizobium leguminosarum]|uniref:hypothetical protein n=1 Tax=Rhizobium leguminosarum TaxID=384 RepID=UPI003F9E65AD
MSNEFRQVDLMIGRKWGQFNGKILEWRQSGVWPKGEAGCSTPREEPISNSMDTGQHVWAHGVLRIDRRARRRIDSRLHQKEEKED